MTKRKLCPLACSSVLFPYAANTVRREKEERRDKRRIKRRVDGGEEQHETIADSIDILKAKKIAASSGNGMHYIFSLSIRSVRMPMHFFRSEARHTAPSRAHASMDAWIAAARAHK